MAFLTPSSTIVVVFLLTSWTLGVSVSRDLAHADAPQLSNWKQHIAHYAKNLFHEPRSEGQGNLAQDVFSTLSIIFRSELTVFLLVQWCFCAYAVLTLLIVRLFLGQLSSREMSRLSERLVKFVVFKAVFYGALIIPDIYEIVLWLAWFGMMGCMRIFMGAAKDRLEALVVSPTATTFSHLRALALVLVILVHDTAGMVALMASLGSMSTTKVLLCAFDMAIVMVEGIKTLLRYAVHMWDHRVASQDSPEEAAGASAGGGGGSGSLGWESWEGKGALLYHTELVADMLVHSMTLAHYMHVWFLHGLSFQLIDAILFLDIRSILLSMSKRVRAYLNYRHATHSLCHAFPDAVLGSSHEQCSICMEKMSSAKQLPCQHHFHLACLRAWLQQSGTESFACPLCRTPLLRERAEEMQAQQLQAQQERQRGAGAGGGGAWLWGAASRLMSTLYLDLMFGLLLGLPSTTAILHRHAAAAAAAAAARQQREALRVQLARRQRRGEDHALERVGENEQPGTGGSEAPEPGRPRRRGLCTFLGMLLGRRSPAADRATEEYSDDDGEYEDYSSDEELHDVATEDDSFQLEPSFQGWREHAHWGTGTGPLLRRHVERGAGEAGVGSSDGPGPLPHLPPPYPEPSTWSAGSLQAAAQHVTHSIRSSWGMGVNGPGAVAGHDHDSDQEVESPYRPQRARARAQRRCPATLLEQQPEVEAHVEEENAGQGANAAAARGRQQQQQRRDRTRAAAAVATVAGDGAPAQCRTHTRSRRPGSGTS